jgi:hypothetical protein
MSGDYIRGFTLHTKHLNSAPKIFLKNNSFSPVFFAIIIYFRILSPTWQKKLSFGKLWVLKEASKNATKTEKNLSGQNRLFFKNVLHPLIRSSFVELDEFYLNICRTRSEKVRLGSYDRPKYTSIREKKPAGQRDILKYFFPPKKRV